jgi:hypothetical protein
VVLVGLQANAHDLGVGEAGVAAMKGWFWSLRRVADWQQRPALLPKPES